MDKDEMKK